MNFTGALYNAIWDKSENSLIFKDNAKANFGTTGTGDLSIYHNSSTVISHIDEANNDLEVNVPGGKTICLKTQGYDTIKAHSLAGTPAANWATLYFNGSERLETEQLGVKITGELRVTDDITAFYVASDQNLKDNITPIEDPLAKVLSISGNTFTWKEGNSNQGEDTGVVAQEIEALGLPGIVKDQESGHKSVQYHKLVPLLIEAIKELSIKVENLEQKISDK